MDFVTLDLGYLRIGQAYIGFNKIITVTFTCRSTLVSQRSPVYPRGQRQTAVSPPVVKHFPPWEQGTLLHLSAVHSSATRINQSKQYWSSTSTWTISLWYFDSSGISDKTNVVVGLVSTNPIEKRNSVFDRRFHVDIDGIVDANMWRKCNGFRFLFRILCLTFNMMHGLCVAHAVGTGSRWGACEIIFRTALVRLYRKCLMNERGFLFFSFFSV